MPEDMKKRADELSNKKEVRIFTSSKPEIRADENGKKLIRGYVVEWEKLSVDLGWFKEKVREGAFTASLRDNTIKALFNHDTSLVLGSTKAKTLFLKEDERGLYYEIDPPESPNGQNAVVAIERGDVDGTSFGFRVRKDEWDFTDDDNPIRTLVDVNLHEISPTPFPAYEGNSSSQVRSNEEVYLSAKSQVADKAENFIQENERERLKLLEKEYV